MAGKAEPTTVRIDGSPALVFAAHEIKSKAASTPLLALKHLCYGELDVARPMLDELIEKARAINEKGALAAGLIWRGCLYFFQSEYERAIEVETEGRQYASELRDGFLLLTAMFFHGLSKANLGQMSEALAILDEGMRLARRNGDLFWHPRMPNCIGWIHRELQDFEGAFKYDQEGFEIGHDCHVLEAEANSLINLGIDYTHAGRPEETVSAFHQVRDIFERDAWFRWRYNIRLHAAMAEHALYQGETKKAREITDQLLAAATKCEVHKYIAVAHQLMARIAVAEGDTAIAESEFGAALEELGRFPAPLVAWKTYANLAQLKHSVGDFDATHAAYAQAAAIVKDIAANVQDESLRELFLESAAVKEVLGGYILSEPANRDHSATDGGVVT